MCAVRVAYRVMIVSHLLPLLRTLLVVFALVTPILLIHYFPVSHITLSVAGVYVRKNETEFQ
jgi:hypothetical protein